MAGIGKHYTFHGNFRSKARAVRKEQMRPGAFIKKTRRGYLVLKPRRR